MTENTNTQNANNIVNPQLIALQKLLENNPTALTNVLNKAEEAATPAMKLERNKTDGTVKNTKHNLNQILQFDPKLKGKFGYNESTQEYTVKEDVKLPAETPNGKATVTIPKGRLDDTALDLLCNYLSDNENYKIETDSKHLMVSMKWVQKVQGYDPLKNYFDTLKWDGKDRLDHVLQDYLGAADSEYNKFQIKLWMMGGVAKVYNKKQKFDFVLDLVGGQGAGKTTFLQAITPLDGMYVQGFNDFSSKDSKTLMKGAFIVNDDEMTATANSTFEEIKSFITATDLDYRVPYGRLPIQFNKSFIIARTGNEIQHLADPSGQRRFLCIQCGLHDHKSVYNDLMNNKKYIEQLWAQAKHDYEETKKHGNPFSLTKEQDEMLNQGRQIFIKSNSVKDTVKDLITNELSNVNFVSNTDMRLVAAYRLGKERQGLSDRDKRSIRTQMAHSGWLSGTRAWDAEIGQQVRGYTRIEEIKTDNSTWGVKEWIDYEINHSVITNGKHMPSKLAETIDYKKKNEAKVDEHVEPLMKDNESYDQMPF